MSRFETVLLIKPTCYGQGAPPRLIQQDPVWRDRGRAPGRAARPAARGNRAEPVLPDIPYSPLAFCYNNQRVVSTVVDVTSLAQLNENVDAWGTRRTPELLAVIDVIRWASAGSVGRKFAGLRQGPAAGIM